MSLDCELTDFADAYHCFLDCLEQMSKSSLHTLMAIPAGMQQRARLKALDRFKANDNAVMVASDVAARGLDITVCTYSFHQACY